MSNDLSSLKASIDMALNAISQVEADVSVLKAQVEEIDGDYPCMIPGIPGGGGGGACWNGTAVDFYGDQILALDVTDSANILGKYIVYHTGLSPTKHPEATWPNGISEGPWAWDMIVRGPPWISWEVGGDEVKKVNGSSYSPKRYELAVGKTCGTIHIPVPIPDEAYKVIQLGAGTGTSTTDNGILANYPRTHA